MSGRLAESPRWGWLSNKWMLPWRYRLPLMVLVVAVAYAGLRLLTDAEDPLAAVLAAIPVMYFADYLWWRRARRRFPSE
jgi:hypothetical protein